jgi:hypothetical protein
MPKTDLKARPIFHRTRDAIEAHLTIVFTALAIARHLQNTTSMSIKKIVQTLRPLQQITLTIAADPLTDTAREIITATKTQRPGTRSSSRARVLSVASRGQVHHARQLLGATAAVGDGLKPAS